MRPLTSGVLGLVASGALTGAVVLGTQLVGGAAAPGEDPRSPSPGQVHASHVHAWVACKAEHGKAACTKPTPPGHLKAKHRDKDEDDEPESD